MELRAAIHRQMLSENRVKSSPYTDKCYLWMVMVFGPANPRIWKVLNYFKTPESAYEGLKSFSFPLSEVEKSHIYNLHIEQAENLYETYLKQDYNIITFEDENYPDILKEISNPPAVLFAMGNLNINEQNPALAMVGARNCSRYSADVTAYLSTELSKLGFTIVSGFARGIDFAAHSAATALHKPTVAVLGTGLDIDYPSEHSEFKYVIRNNGGCVLSEYFLGTKGHSAYFPIRNRIISGLSRGTIVVEAKNGSGSLLTANYAIEQNRDLFCVTPGNIFSQQYSGVVKYLRDGAIPVYSYIDVAREYISELEETAEMSTPKTKKPDKPVSIEKSTEKSVEKSVEKSDLNQKNQWKYITPEKYEKEFGLIKKEKPVNNKIDYSEFDEITTDIIKLIETEPVSMDEICENLDIDITDLMLILDSLQLKNIVRETQGRYEIRS